MADLTRQWRMSQSQLFSSGSEVGNLVVTSGVLSDSWDVNSALYREINNTPSSNCPVRFKIDKRPNCNIIAFVTWPPCTKEHLQAVGAADFVSSSALKDTLPLFEFLCSKTNPCFSINKLAVECFKSIRGVLPFLRSEVLNYKPLLITGHGLGGSVASLFTLWLLSEINLSNTKRPLCVTFGSPLIGDEDLREAILQYSAWNSCFLHVVSALDPLPRVLTSTHNPPSIESASRTNEYKPFGTFMLCSELGFTCFEEPEFILEFLKATYSEASLTEDSCFWAHVEEARISCKLLIQNNESSIVKRQHKYKLNEFEGYVLGLLSNYAVSPEIFLPKSSFMGWWKEYKEIIDEGIMGTSYSLRLTNLMKTTYSEVSPQFLDYKPVVEQLKLKVICEDKTRLDGSISDPLLAGITVQVLATGLGQNSDMIDTLTTKTRESIILKRQVVDPSKELNDVKINMAQLEWYKKTSKDNRIGYYDSYRNGSFTSDLVVEKFKKPLTWYWENLVDEVDKKPQKEGASFRTRWLFGGTNYRRMIEPLDIAAFYRDGHTDYLKVRPKHYKLLEEWLNNDQRPASITNINSKKKNVEASLTEDSCSGHTSRRLAFHANC